jgi:diaminobutyrate acetyltransferase
MTAEDGPNVAALVRRCGTLDSNSTYAYVLMGDRFGHHGVVAERAGAVIGFVTGFRDSRDPSVLFLWQIGVDASARGQGLAAQLLEAFVGRPANRDARALETTVARGNIASDALFRAFARRHDASIEPTSSYPSAWLDGHPEEQVIRISPLPIPSNANPEV